MCLDYNSLSLFCLKRNGESRRTHFNKDEKDLSEEDKHQVDKLKKRDQEVRAHESAHLSAGSGLVMGGASYEYERGPDGKTYAVAGEVTIDTSRERDPEATIRKMQKVRKAALAPAQPSGRDRSVAAQASQIEAEARIELQKQKSKAPDEKNSFDDKLRTRISTDPLYSPDDPLRIGHNLNLIV
jgi:SprA-related family